MNFIALVKSLNNFNPVSLEYRKHLRAWHQIMCRNSLIAIFCTYLKRKREKYEKLISCAENHPDSVNKYFFQHENWILHKLDTIFSRKKRKSEKMKNDIDKTENCHPTWTDRWCLNYIIGKMCSCSHLHNHTQTHKLKHAFNGTSQFAPFLPPSSIDVPLYLYCRRLAWHFSAL